jgi:tetratricopeptide (TPR) repeat protein
MNKKLISEGKPPINFSGCCAHASPEMLELAVGLDKAQGVPLEFEFELKEVQMPDAYTREPWEMDPNQKYEEIPLRKNEGAEYYKKGDWDAALAKYERCLVLIESLNASGAVLDLKKERMDKKNGRMDGGVVSESNIIELEVLENLERLCRLNYAACKLKLKDYPSVIVHCTEVLRHDSKCVKALFRRGQAYLEIGRDLDLAQEDFDMISKCVDANSSECRELQVQQSKLAMKLKIHADKEKEMYKGKLF